MFRLSADRRHENQGVSPTKDHLTLRGSFWGDSGSQGGMIVSCRLHLQHSIVDFDAHSSFHDMRDVLPKWVGI